MYYFSTEQLYYAAPFNLFFSILGPNPILTLSPSKLRPNVYKRHFIELEDSRPLSNKSMYFSIYIYSYYTLTHWAGGIFESPCPGCPSISFHHYFQKFFISKKNLSSDSIDCTKIWYFALYILHMLKAIFCCCWISTSCLRDFLNREWWHKFSL